MGTRDKLKQTKMWIPEPDKIGFMKSSRTVKIFPSLFLKLLYNLIPLPQHYLTYVVSYKLRFEIFGVVCNCSVQNTIIY